MYHSFVIAGFYPSLLDISLITLLILSNAMSKLYLSQPHILYFMCILNLLYQVRYFERGELIYQRQQGRYLSGYLTV